MTGSKPCLPDTLRTAWVRLPTWVSILFLLALVGLCWSLTIKWFDQDIYLLVVSVTFITVGLPAAWIDLGTLSLPSSLTWPLALVLLIVVLCSGAFAGEWDRTLRAVLAACLAAVVGLIFAITTSLGLGDVKLGISIGMSLGFISWQAFFSGLFFGLLSGGLTALVLLLHGRSSTSYLPLGPYLVFGTCLCFLTC